MPPSAPDLEAIVENVIVIVLSCLLGVGMCLACCVSLARAHQKLQQQREAASRPPPAAPQTALDRLIVRMVAAGHVTAAVPVQEGVVLSAVTSAPTAAAAAAASSSRSTSGVQQHLSTAQASTSGDVVIGVPVAAGAASTRIDAV